MVSAFEQGVALGPFCDSLIINLMKTFSEIRRRAVAHINVEEVVAARNNGSHSWLAKPKEVGKTSRPMRVSETSTRKKEEAKHHPYKKGEFMERGKDKEFHLKFRVSYKELIGIPAVAEKLRFPQKADRNLGGRKDIWCKFHKRFGHGIERCMALSYQLAELLKDGFLKEYLEVEQGEPQGEAAIWDKTHEVPVHGELNTISGSFLEEAPQPPSVKDMQGQ